ncbi:flagellar hook-length control protein FliK [Acidaminobacter hydrogenoformans]|uniref:Hook-length control protein FliK n=1 Tax=Acidaminobacter hydrogenoformans DSM 2784 TaxID=1120920 RepID=A0A1G5RUL1_9FIRM|nr:flagellar hook-length control protein FliK [Acidaminobacter hydrogenoformans]SCZ77794.1 hook-length control protein FliK [Acidaminobacter hydrogenoformans DSM 2784]
MNTAAVPRGSTTHQTEKQWKSSAHKSIEATGQESMIFSGVLKQCLANPQENDSGLSDALEDRNSGSGAALSDVIHAGALGIAGSGDKTAQQSAAALHRQVKEGYFQGSVTTTAQIPGSAQMSAAIPSTTSALTLGSQTATDLMLGRTSEAGTLTSEGETAGTDFLQAMKTGKEAEKNYQAESLLAEKANPSSVTGHSKLEIETLKKFQNDAAAPHSLEASPIADATSRLKPLEAKGQKPLETETPVQNGKGLSSVASDPVRTQLGEMTLNSQPAFEAQHQAEPFLHSLAAKETVQTDFASEIKASQTEAAAIVSHLSGPLSENEVAPQAPIRTARIPEFPELIAQQAQLMKAGETKSLRLMLNPEHLGSLEIELSLKNGVLTGAISVETELAHELFQKHLPQFLSTLDSKQISTGTFEMHYHGENSGFSNHADQGSEERQSAYPVTEAETNQTYSAQTSVEQAAHKRLDLLA